MNYSPQLKSVYCQEKGSPTTNINRFQQHYENVLFYDLATKLNLNNSEEVPSIEKIIISSSVNFQPKQTRGMVQESYSIKKTAKKGKKSNKNANQGAPTSAKDKAAISAQKSQSARERNSANLTLDIPSQVQAAFILLTGQKPEERLFRVSRPGLNIREGRLAAFRVTLRKKSTYFFLERLITDILPNLKGDTFKGFNSKPHLKSTSNWLDDGSKIRQMGGSNWDGHGNFHFGIKNLYSFREIDQSPIFTQLNGLNISIITTAKTDLEGQLLLSGFQFPWPRKD